VRLRKILLIGDHKQYCLILPQKYENRQDARFFTTTKKFKYISGLTQHNTILHARSRIIFFCRGIAPLIPNVTLDGGEGLTARSGPFTQGKKIEPPAPGRFEEENNFLPLPGFQPRTLHRLRYSG
jgi:hypothetical protein